MSLDEAGAAGDAGDVTDPGDAGDAVALARELIRVPSPNPPGDERAVAELTSELAVAAGLPAPEVLSLSAERPNLLFTVDFGSGGRHLAFCGHLDTKPIGDAVWTADPLGAEIEGDRLYGLGSADMKGAVAAMIVAVARLVQGGGPAAGRVSLLFTADEEDGARYGAQFLAETLDLRADAVLIGEPGGLDDDYDQLHLGSRGIARMRATAYARQGHSSLSARPGTRNAGVDAARAAVALADRLAPREPADQYGLLGWNATVNTGLAFRGGVGYGVLPDRMGVDTEVRLLPGMSRADVEEPAAGLLAELARETGADLRLEFDEQGLLPGTVADPGGALPAAVRWASERVLGRVPPDAMFPGTTDASWLQPAWNVPVLPAFGPGLLRRCHGADEWVSVTALRQAVELYAAIAEDFCAGAAGDSP